MKRSKTRKFEFETKDGNIIQLSISEKERYVDHLAAKKELNELKTLANSQTSAFGDVVEQILDLALPKSFFLDHLYDSSHSAFADRSAYPFIFPSTSLHRLLSCPTLEELKFGRWEMPKIPPEVQCSADVAAADAASQVPSASLELTSLRFPMDKKFASIPLSSLLYIAHRFPRLARVECYITISSPATLELDLDTHIAHRALEILSVNGPILQKDQIPVATYLSLLFPHLKAIETSNDSTEGWDYIYSLVKMCQTVSFAVKKQLQQSTTN